MIRTTFISATVFLVGACASSSNDVANLKSGTSGGAQEFSGLATRVFNNLLEENDVKLTSVTVERSSIKPLAVDNAAHQELAAGGPGEKILNLASEKNQPPAILATLQGVPNDGGWMKEGETYLHTYSGMECDTSHKMILQTEGGRDEEFIVPLVEIRVYDDKGYDTHCHYQDNTGLRYFTIYASYWPDITLDQSAGAAYSLILDRFDIKEEATLAIPQFQVEEDWESTIEGPTKIAAFLVNLPDRPEMKTALWINKTGGWHIKERATYANGDLGSEILGSILHFFALLQVDKHINTNGSSTSNQLAI